MGVGPQGRKIGLMPVHKVSGGYKWGKHGKVYPNRAGAERQARAAYANGYQGKAFDPMGAVMELAGGVYGNRTYLAPGEEAPEGVEVKTGPMGGRYYLNDGGGAQQAAERPRQKSASEVLGLFVEGRDFPLARGQLLTQKQTNWLERAIDQALRGGKPVGNGKGLASKDGTVTRWPDGTVITTADGSEFMTKRQRNGTMLVTRMKGGSEPERPQRPKTEVPEELADHVRQAIAETPAKPGQKPEDRLLDLYHAAVSMYRPGGDKLSSWINAVGGRDFLQSQNARLHRKGLVMNLIRDELERQGGQKMSNSYATSLVELAEEVSDLVSKAPGYQGRPGPDPKTFARKKTKEQHFAVHEDDSGERVPLPKERHYLKEGEEAPPSVFVQEGPRGGRFYEVPARGKAKAEEPAKEGAGSMAVVADQPADNPTREVKPTPSTSQIVDVEEAFESTMARIKQVLAAAKIPQSEALPDGKDSPGYEVQPRDDTFEVYGKGRDEEEAKKVLALVRRALEAATDLNADADDDHVVVEALEGDPAADLFGDDIDVELDPLLSEKSWSHGEAILVSGLIAKGVAPEAAVAALSAERLARLV